MDAEWHVVSEPYISKDVAIKIWQVVQAGLFILGMMFPSDIIASFTSKANSRRKVNMRPRLLIQYWEISCRPMQRRIRANSFLAARMRRIIFRDSEIWATPVISMRYCNVCLIAMPPAQICKSLLRMAAGFEHNYSLFANSTWLPHTMSSVHPSCSRH